MLTIADRSVRLGALVLVILAALICVAASTGVISIYTVTLLGKYLCYALAALSLDLIWGYLGILSLGHCAFFALGAYAMGMYLSLQSGPLPEFMRFLNWQELPWYWQGSHYFIPSLLLSLLMPGLLALIFGALTFRSRVGGVYLSIITQALTYALMLLFFLNEFGFGGNNGLTGFSTILGFDITSDGVRIALFAITALVLALALFILGTILKARPGKILIAVRDSESRMRFLGYRVENFKLCAFVLAAMLAGLAGALYVPQVGIINPSEFSPLNSIELVVCVALGGRGRLVGAVIGALLLNFIKTFCTAAFPEIWLYILGAIFVTATIFLPKGLAGLLTMPRRA